MGFLKHTANPIIEVMKKAPILAAAALGLAIGSAREFKDLAYRGYNSFFGKSYKDSNPVLSLDGDYTDRSQTDLSTIEGLWTAYLNSGDDMHRIQRIHAPLILPLIGVDNLHRKPEVLSDFGLTKFDPEKISQLPRDRKAALLKTLTEFAISLETEKLRLPDPLRAAKRINKFRRLCRPHDGYLKLMRSKRMFELFLEGEEPSPGPTLEVETIDTNYKFMHGYITQETKTSNQTIYIYTVKYEGEFRLAGQAVFFSP